MQKLVANGIEWLYRPGIVYTGLYQGWNINIRKIGRKQGKNWRLYISQPPGGGIGLAWKHQFHATVAEARRVAIDLINRKDEVLADLVKKDRGD